MFFLSIRNWLKQQSQPAKDRAARLRRTARPRLRLFLEPLEDRTLLSWTPIGPAPLTGEGFAGNTNSGRITSIAADPSNANTVYIAAAGGGIWKTTDAQDANPTWTPLTDNIPGTTDTMGAIAIAPSNSSVIYAGTGEANNSLDSNYGEGILVSTDAGSTWTLENPGGIFTNLTVSKIVVDPSNANIAYAAVGNAAANTNFPNGTGIFKTADGGKTWTNTTTSITTIDSFSDVVIDPSTSGNTATLYAAVGYPFGDTPNGIYKSTNAGGTWTLLSNFPNGSSDGRISLAISASNPSVIYAAVAQPESNTPSSGGLLDLEESTDGGSTWTNLTNAPNFPGSQGWYDLSIAVDPTTSSTVYVGGSGSFVNGVEDGNVYVSTDSGANWTAIQTDDNSVGPHADIHSLVFDANNRLLVGSDGGIYRQDSDPKNANGFLWTDLNGNLNTIQFYSLSVNPSNGDVLGGSQDNGTDLYANGTWTETDGGDGGMAFASSTLAYHASPVASFGASFFRVSNDGGNTWTTATNGLNSKDPMNFITPFTVDPSNPDRVVLGSNQIYQTTNAAGTWTQLTTTNANGWNPSGNNVDAIGLAASDAKTIYASTGGEFASSSQIFVSTDDGTTWTERDLPSGSGRVNQIIVDPNSATTAYAVVSTFGGGHVFKTTNGGQTWTDISGNLPNLPTWTIQLDAVDNILYVGNDEGVYSSLNGGATWSPFGTGLPNAQVFALDYVPSLNILAAGTHGRGAWEIPAGAPLVTTNPTNQTVIEGQTATFTASAIGTPTPTVQWQVSSDGGKTFTNIAGATSTTLTLPNVQFSQNGTEYQAVFTNTFGSATTTAASLTVETVPVVTTNPTNQTVSEGQTATFTASAAGNPAPTVQWQISTDGGNTFTNINGATNTTLTLPNAQLSQNGTEYQAVFTNAAGSATTTAATLTVTKAPVITTNPANQTVIAGQTATFTASATGNPTPTVQWQISSDGGNTFTNIAGATSTTLTLPNVPLSQSGTEYQAVFTNTFGTATTTAASLTVETVPVVTTNPVNQTVMAGQTATFTASASGTPTPTVQWQVSSDGGKTFTNIAGATSAMLTLSNVQLSLNGDEYQAVFTNSAGSATTSAATLTVDAPPTVTSNPANQTVVTGQTATFTASASGNPTPTVQWQVSSDGGKTFSNVAGAASATLTLSSVQPSQNGNEYQAVFTNAFGSATTTAATLTVETAPVVTTNPLSQTVVSGQTATFTATASGTPTPTVQWQVSTDGGKTFTNIAGATSATLTLPNVQFSQNDDEYQAVFTNILGSATTTAATLTVETVPVATTNPLSQTVMAGQTATFTASASGTPTPTVQWQISSDGGNTFTNIAGATSATLTLSNVQLSLNGDEYQAVFTNAAGSATTSAATLTVDAPPTVTINPTNQTVVTGQTATFTASVSGNPTPTVQWQVSSDGGNTFSNISGATSATLTLSSVQPSQNGNEYQAVFTNTFGSATTTAATLIVAKPPRVMTDPASQTVTAGQTATFTASANGTPTPNVQWQLSSDGGKTFSNISGATNTTLTISNVQSSQSGDEYAVVFTNLAGIATTSTATLTVQTVPVVTTNPMSQTVTVGQTATFTAAGGGNPTPTMQWQVSTDGGNTFIDISGATSPTLTLSNVRFSQNGYEYQAVFTNAAGAVATSAATLTVDAPPTVTSNPANQTVIVGQTATFTASVSGNPTPTVQWQVSSDGGNTFTNISGAASATLTLSNVPASQNGDEYQAVFTNTFGAATTSAATLTVQTVPAVTTNPVNQTVTAGQTATFTASASGNPTPTVQWQVSSDGGNTFTNISGAASATLTLSNVLFSQNGYEYQAVFTNTLGAVTTSAATLTVQTVPAVTANPADQTVLTGQTATFTASASGSPTPTMQWQVSSDGGKTFANISGATSTTLTLSNVQFSLNGDEYQAVFTNAAGAAATSAATLTVQTMPAVTANPASPTVIAGQTATFTASASGNPTPAVQWQVSSDGGKTFTNISGATSTTLTLSNVQFSQNDYEYQAVFTNIVGTTTTSAATLTVTPVAVNTTASNASAVFNTQTQTVTLNAGIADPSNAKDVVGEGTVTFTIANGSVTVGSVQGTVSNGKASASFTLPAGQAAGSYAIEVSYNDSQGNFSDSGDTNATLTVTPATVTTTASNVSAVFSPNARTATLNAAVADASYPSETVGEGTVTFTIENGNSTVGSVQGTVGNGKASASFTLPAGLPAGSYAVEVRYSDSQGNFSDGGDTNGTLTVAPAKVTTTANNAATFFNTQAQTVTLSAAVADSSNANDVVDDGTVTFTIENGGSILGRVQGVVSGGTANASFTLPAGLPIGSYAVAVSYSDSQGNFTDSGDNSGTLTVGVASTTTQLTQVSLAPNLLAQTVTETLTAHVNSSTTVNQGTVTFTVSNQTLRAGVDANGNAAVSLILPAQLASFPQSISVQYVDPASDLTVSTDTETAPWQSINAVLPSTFAFNALERTVTADILGFLYSVTYNAAGLMTEIDFGSLQLVFSYNAFNQLAGVILNGIAL